MSQEENYLEEEIALENGIDEKEEGNSSKESSINSKISNAKWIDNQGNAVEEVFGFNENSELVNGRAAMFGFLMLILTELVFKGIPVSKSIFGIG